MEYRKLIKFGNSSYVISLPKDWITKQNLQKGEIIYFEENDASDLVISGKKNSNKEGKKVISLHIDGMTERQIELEIIASYMKDFSRIVLTGNEIAKRDKEIRDILKRLVAIEVIEQTKDKIVAKDFLNLEEIKIPDLRKRLDTVVRSMITDSKIGNGKENYESINIRDYDANKFAYVILRVIRRGFEQPSVRKSLGVSLLELVYEQLVILAIERIGDRAKRIAREDSRSSITKSEIAELNKVYDMIFENYQDAIKAYTKKEYELSCKSFSRNRDILAECDKIRSKHHSPGAIKIVYLLREMSQKVSELGEIGFMAAESTISKKSFEQKTDAEAEQKPL